MLYISLQENIKLDKLEHHFNYSNHNPEYSHKVYINKHKIFISVTLHKVKF